MSETLKQQQDGDQIVGPATENVRESLIQWMAGEARGIHLRDFHHIDPLVPAPEND